MSKLDYFTNDSFKILNYLYDHRNGENITSVTQQELADLFGLSRVTVNKLIGDLAAKNYIKKCESKMARYQLSQEAIDFVKGVQALSRK